MADALKILAFSGSIRKASFNRMLLKEIQDRAPKHGMQVESWDRMAETPLFDGDMFAKGFPPAVEDFRNRLRAADALIIVSPEYNHSIAGTTKNLIDYASRAPDQPFAGKPIGVTGAAMGAMGTAWAQYATRLSLVFLDGRIMNQPEVFVGSAQNKFDAAGKLTDQPTVDILERWLAAFPVWVRQVGVKK